MTNPLNGDSCWFCGRRAFDYHHYSCPYFSEALKNYARYFLDEPDIATWESEGGQ